MTIRAQIIGEIARNAAPHIQERLPWGLRKMVSVTLLSSIALTCVPAALNKAGEVAMSPFRRHKEQKARKAEASQVEKLQAQVGSRLDTVEGELKALKATLQEVKAGQAAIRNDLKALNDNLPNIPTAANDNMEGKKIKRPAVTSANNVVTLKRAG